MRRAFVAIATVLVVVIGTWAALRANLIELPGEPAEVEGAATTALAADLSELRGENGLVRASAEVRASDAGRLYTTAYARTALQASDARLPELAPDAVVEMIAGDTVHSPGWIAFYACLAARTEDRVDARSVLVEAGMLDDAISGARAYLDELPRGHEDEEQATTVTTAASFVSALHCVGAGGEVPPRALDFLRDEQAGAEVNVARLAAVRALEDAGRSVEPVAAPFEPPAACSGWDAMEAAATAKLRLRAGAEDVDQSLLACATLGGVTIHEPQTVAAVAELAVDVPRLEEEVEPSIDAMGERIRDDGSVDVDVDVVGSLRSTLFAARALAAAGAETPTWLAETLESLARDPDELSADDQVVLAATCHRLGLSCEGLVQSTRRDLATRLPLPETLSDATAEQWQERAMVWLEVGVPVPEPLLEVSAPRPWEELDPVWLGVATSLGQGDHPDLVGRIGPPEGLVGEARRRLAAGDLVGAAHATYAGVLTGHPPEPEARAALEAATLRYRVPGGGWLFAREEGGPADAQATHAGILLLGLVESDPGGRG